MKEILGVADIETISKLADIVNDKELSEITINANGGSITIKGKKPLPVPPPVMAVPPVPQAVQAAPQQPAEVPAAKAKEEINGGNIVKSPIVGTYYRSPSPDKPPFVKVGDKVKKGDVIMIIESMKLMNEVQSEFDGVVERILVSDGQAVEFDQPIMIIK
ncbi:MAG: acetyl-CoA carboxylase biotin carboxyl carrier protein [Ruminococcus sp.]|jgi:acetyl-CoA carboxylase biotin carboxyl carrier protein|nr:acetyl-CoA carboxylase biotin carboxyl carrier protein [Ruminococcus sp.]